MKQYFGIIKRPLILTNNTSGQLTTYTSQTVDPKSLSANKNAGQLINIHEVIILSYIYVNIILIFWIFIFVYS